MAKIRDDKPFGFSRVRFVKQPPPARSGDQSEGNKELAVMDYWRRLRSATCFYVANHLFMKLPSYALRHWYLRQFCGLKLGRDSSIHMNCFVTGYDIEIGHHTIINRQTYLDGRVPLKIGNNVNVSHQVMIHTLTHDPQDPGFACVEGPVEIGDYVWIGARALILPGVRVGEGAVIGAGAVVTRDIPPYAIAAGNPARVIKQRNRQLTYQVRYFPFYDTDVQ